MSAFRFGDVTIERVIEIPRSAYPTASMLPESTPAAIARHDGWLKPHFYGKLHANGVTLPSELFQLDDGVERRPVRAVRSGRR